MTGTKRDAKVGRTDVQGHVTGRGSLPTRPYYWSWYGTVFGDQEPARRLPTVFPRTRS